MVVVSSVTWRPAAKVQIEKWCADGYRVTPSLCGVVVVIQWVVFLCYLTLLLRALNFNFKT